MIASPPRLATFGGREKSGVSFARKVRSTSIEQST